MGSMRTILVTGAHGVVGRRVVPRLTADGHQVIAATRTYAGGGRNVRMVGDIGPQTDWRAALEDVDTVVHLAARTPAAGVTEEDYERVNIQGTARLLRDATASGVGLLVFVSSVFAVAVHSTPVPVDEATPPNPNSAYGRSKLAAEDHVLGFCGPGRAAVILRPPLVHAPDAKSNWGLLQRLAQSPMPLPFGRAANRRSVISADDFADAIAAVIAKGGDDTINGTYMVADDPPLSLRDIVHHLRVGAGRSPRLIGMPLALMRVPLQMAGLRQMAESLFGDLVVDSSLFRHRFGWVQTADSASEIERTGAARASRWAATAAG